MFLKCCNPKDLTEFMVNCLFPILENYLNTQQNETYAMQTMESISKHIYIIFQQIILDNLLSI